MYYWHQMKHKQQQWYSAHCPVLAMDMRSAAKLESCAPVNGDDWMAPTIPFLNVSFDADSTCKGIFCVLEDLCHLRHNMDVCCLLCMCVMLHIWSFIQKCCSSLHFYCWMSRYKKGCMSNIWSFF
uniref:Uncharacterized protein n=1 Tax=Rhipicephalus zambeziensis TaxID=60191 RepID=A0A224Y967_9ACAR